MGENKKTILIYTAGAGGEFIGTTVQPYKKDTHTLWNKYYYSGTIPLLDHIITNCHYISIHENFKINYFYNDQVSTFKTKQEYIKKIKELRVHPEHECYIINNWESNKRNFWLSHHHAINRIFSNTECIFLISNSMVLKWLWGVSSEIKNDLFKPLYDELRYNTLMQDETVDKSLLYSKVRIKAKENKHYRDTASVSIINFLNMATKEIADKNNYEKEYLSKLKKIKNTENNISFIIPSQLDTLKPGLFNEYKGWVERNIQLFNDVYQVDFPLINYIHYD